MPDVPLGVLQNIFDRLTRLENTQQSAAAEALVPNYIILDAQGRVVFQFAGIIQAHGLTLPTGSVTVTPASQINWTADGQTDPTRIETQGTIQTFLDIASNVEMDVETTSPAAGVNTLLRLLAFIGGAESAELDAATVPGDTLNTRVSAAASAGASATTVVIVTADNRSSFVQAAAGAPALKRGLDWGTGTLAFGGGTTASVVVNHAIGRPPVAIAALLSLGAVPGAQVTLEGHGATNTQFTVAALSSGAIAGNVTFLWFAGG